MKKIAACPSKLWQSGASLLKSVVSCHLSVVVLSFLLLTTSYLLLANLTPVHAQENPCPKETTGKEAINELNELAIKKDIFDDKIFNINQIAGTTDSLLNLLTGCSLIHPETNDATANKGALSVAGSLVASLYGAPPVSGVNYFASQFQKFNPVQPAYAQAGTIGFDALQPVQKIWTAFRNIAYVGFVIVFVIIGFMIMFRAHISPQAVATIQDSIPRIVVALILVTFSYAIAGFLIDAMFVFLNLVINALASQGLIQVDKANFIFEKSVFGVVWKYWGSTIKEVFSAISGIIDSLIKIPVFDKVVAFGFGGVAALIVAIAMLFIMFRVFLMLLMAYVTIILLTMFAPFFFLIQALPGNTGTREWFKQMAANIAVFPTVALMFIFAAIIGGLENLGVPRSVTFPDQQVGQFPLFWGDLQIADIGKLIGIGFLLITPTVAQMIKEMIGAKGPQLGPAAAGTLGAAGRVAAFPVTAAVSRYNERRRSEQLRDILNAPKTPEPAGQQPGERGGEPAIGRGH